MKEKISNLEFIKFLYKNVKKYKHKLTLLYIIRFVCKNFLLYYVLPYILKIIGDDYEKNILTIKSGLILVVLYALVYSIDYIIEALFLNRLVYRTEYQIEKDLRVNLFKRVIKQSMQYFSNNMSGTLASKINNVANNINRLLDNSVFIVADFLSIILTFIIYLCVNIYLSLFFVIWYIAFFITNYVIVKGLNIVSMDISEEKNKTNGIINDDFSNIVNIKSFSSQKRESYNIKKQGMAILSKEYFSVKKLNMANFIFFLFLFVLIFVVYSTSFYLVYKKEITIGTFLLICQNILFLKSSITDFINKVFEACGYVADIKVSLKTILEPIKILDKENAKNLEIKEGRISIKNITFGYK